MRGTRRYTCDGLGSVLGEIDGDAGSSTRGDLTKSRVYDVYDTVRAEDANYSKSGHRFVGGLGHPSEGETGLIYMRARYMDPSTGRFVSEDPGMNGANWFAYCRDDPVNGRDPDGKKFVMPGSPEEWIATVILNVIAALGYDKKLPAWADHACNAAQWYYNALAAMRLCGAGAGACFAEGELRLGMNDPAGFALYMTSGTGLLAAVPALGAMFGKIAIHEAVLSIGCLADELS